MGNELRKRAFEMFRIENQHSDRSGGVYWCRKMVTECSAAALSYYEGVSERSDTGFLSSGTDSERSGTVSGREKEVSERSKSVIGAEKLLTERSDISFATQKMLSERSGNPSVDRERVLCRAAAHPFPQKPTENQTINTH